MEKIAQIVVHGINNALIPIIAYNYGAGKQKRIKETIRWAFIITAVVMTIILIVMELIPDKILLLFDASENMKKLNMDADCIYANAVEFTGYADYDVFYFYNPFGQPSFKRVIQKIKESQEERDREIWVLYYHPVFGELFENAGFTVENECMIKPVIQLRSIITTPR